MSGSPYNNIFTVPSEPTTLSMTISLMVYRYYFILHTRSKYLYIFPLSFIFTYWSVGTTQWELLFFAQPFFFYISLGLVTNCNWMIPISQSKIILCIFSDGLWIMHMLCGRRRCSWCNGYCRMDSATRVQMLDETDCISHSTNTIGKSMNPIILPPAMGK